MRNNIKVDIDGARQVRLTPSTPFASASLRVDQVAALITALEDAVIHLQPKDLFERTVEIEGWYSVHP